MELKKLSAKLSLLFFLLFSSLGYAANPLFDDVTSSAGVSGSLLSQFGGAGLGWIDFDNDGWQDLFIANSQGANKLYRNRGDVNGDGVHDGFELSSTNVGSGGTGVSVGDYDNDGWDDILVTTPGGLTLLKNSQTGQFFFYTPAVGLDTRAPGSQINYSASFGDLDGDGDLDLYVGNWPSGPNNLYINHVNEVTGAFAGKFENIVLDSTSKNWTWATTMTDFDQDGDLDIYATNDTGVDPSIIYENDGNANFTVNSSTGLGAIVSGMGIAVGDYNLDGKFDYYLSSIAPNALLLNDGTNKFNRREVQAGVTGSEGAPTGGTYWGSAFFDANNDGYPDLYAANDSTTIAGSSIPDVNHLYLNNKDISNPNGPTFTEVSAVSNAGASGGSGLALADYDNDGRVDVVTQNLSGKVVLLRNVTSQADNDWLELRLSGIESNNRGIGAKIRVTSTSAAGTITQLQEVHAGTSFASAHAFPVHFGFPANSIIDKVRVEWPSGVVQALSVMALNQSVVVTEEDSLLPSITAIWPSMQAPEGSYVYMSGLNFCPGGDCTSTVIKLGDVTMSAIWMQDNFTYFIIPTGTPSGPIKVSTSASVGVATSAVFTVQVPPTIDSMAPASGLIGTQGMISGDNFCPGDCFTPLPAAENFPGVSLLFNGTPATFLYVSKNNVFFEVPLGATTGPVVLITPEGIVSAGQFTVSVPPVINNIWPSNMQAPEGSYVYMKGLNFCPGEDCTSTVIKLGDVIMSAIWMQDNFMYFIIPAGTPSGPIKVSTSVGEVASAVFTVQVPPTIDFMTPASGLIGTQGMISGDNFCPGDCFTPLPAAENFPGISLSFNGTPATFLYVSKNNIFFEVPAGATTGSVILDTPEGRVSAGQFTVTP